MKYRLVFFCMFFQLGCRGDVTAEDYQDVVCGFIERCSLQNNIPYNEDEDCQQDHGAGGDFESCQDEINMAFDCFKNTIEATQCPAKDLWEDLTESGRANIITDQFEEDGGVCKDEAKPLLECEA